MLISVNCFQSILKSKIEFKGFAVVTGESNLGKSALIRSVSASIFGLPGDAYVRRGFSAAAVGVKFDDSLTLKWQKVPTSKKSPGKETTLDINGVAHTKLGRDHFSLTKPLGFVSISTPAGELRPQVAGQFDKAFLLDVNESVVAEVFRALGRGDVVATARDSAKRDLGREKSEYKIRDADLTGARALVDAKAWVRPFAGDVTGLQSKIKALEPLAKTLASAEAWLAVDLPSVVPKVPTLPDLGSRIKLLEGLQGIREIEIPPIPEQRDSGLVSLLKKVTDHLREGEDLASSKGKLNADLAAKSKELEDLEVLLGVCPTCGATFKDHNGIQH